MKPEINEVAVQKADEYAKKTFGEYYESPGLRVDVGDCKGYFYDGFMQGYQYAKKEKCDKPGYQPESKLNIGNPPKGGKSIMGDDKQSDLS